MSKLQSIFESNKNWSADIKKEDPTFFERLSNQQAPKYLWIGCSDSRVPATQLCGLDAGEIFVHRNIANLVINTDFNCLSVIQYAVEVLKVTDIIVCGHYGCGGVAAALSNQSLGLIDNWIRNIKDVYHLHREEMVKYVKGSEEECNRLTELNVSNQVYNLANTTIVQNAWKRSQELNLHGVVYSLKDGILKDQGICLSSDKDIEEVFKLS
ncbi:carbonate dehydratase [Halobacteriovorax sp. HLS]|uniref:carbonate dehydratase n=1 Tax=Halobacteriovorax sp. HLS TaxID=2234000 RepID=UPI000FD97922|nr:carbonate dehydratase [Halobacteriovorax sp. HLS]